ncbi:MAG: hypothetical protein U1F98_10460 [Verrucomicrobiota bacterium]
MTLLLLLILPALAGSKAESWRTQCKVNMKQIGGAFNAYANDRSDQYPPAGLDNGTSVAQAAWDGYLQVYLGGRWPQANMTYGTIPIEYTPLAEWCPADVKPSGWMSDWAGRRSYAMIPPGGYQVGYMVPANNRKYVLPPLASRSPCGVGVYWRVLGDSSVDWEARGYRTTAVQDPGGSLLLVEEPFNNQAAGNIWACFCMGPYSAVRSELYQVSPPTNAPTSIVPYGSYVYRLHGDRFNYLFHDGHVAPLTIEQTVGSGTLTNALGMWTTVAGD